MASGTSWGYRSAATERHGRTNVADHGHDLDRLDIGVLLVPFAEEQAAARDSRPAAQ
jgi:hypothetical protein